jgi:hypothetical protein
VVHDIGRRRFLSDTVLEVVDVERGVAVAGTVTDHARLRFHSRDAVGDINNEVDGVPEVVVVRITLDRDAGNRSVILAALSPSR